MGSISARAAMMVFLRMMNSGGNKKGVAEIP